MWCFPKIFGHIILFCTDIPRDTVLERLGLLSMSHMSDFLFPRYHNLQDNRSYLPKFSICVRYWSSLLVGKIKFKQSLSSSSHSFQPGVVFPHLKICGGVPLATREVNGSAVSQTDSPETWRFTPCFSMI